MTPAPRLLDQFSTGYTWRMELEPRLLQNVKMVLDGSTTMDIAICLQATIHPIYNPRNFVICMELTWLISWMLQRPPSSRLSSTPSIRRMELITGLEEWILIETRVFNG